MRLMILCGTTLIHLATVCRFLFNLIFLTMLSAKHHKWTVVCIQVMLYTRIKGRGRGVTNMQFCTYICHIRIYRPSLINSNKWGNQKEGKRIETSVKVESRRKRNLARFFFSAANTCISWATRRCIAPKTKRVPCVSRGADQSYVTSMATVFSDKLFSAGLSCSWFSLKQERRGWDTAANRNNALQQEGTTTEGGCEQVLAGPELV